MKKLLLTWSSLAIFVVTPAVRADQYGDFSYSTDGATVTIIGYSGSGGAVTVPSTISGLPVTSIANWAFGNSALLGVTIPDSVTSIGDDAFYRSTGLTSVILPSSVTRIGRGAFEACQGLASVVIPDSVTWIGDLAFNLCSALTRVTIPAGHLGAGAFSNCGLLTDVVIPDRVTWIGSRPFNGCGSLVAITVDPLNPAYCGVEGVLFDKARTTLFQYPVAKKGSYTVPDSVTTIADSAFSACYGLASIVMSHGVVDIGTHAFYSCTSLTSVTLPNGVTHIGNEAFYACSALLSMTIPESVTSIGTWAFAGGCTSLSTFHCQGDAPLTDGTVFGSTTTPTVYYLPGTTGWSPTFNRRPTVP